MAFPDGRSSDYMSRDRDDTASVVNGSYDLSSIPSAGADFPASELERSNVRASYDGVQQVADGSSLDDTEPQSPNGAVPLEDEEKDGLLSQSPRPDRKRKCDNSWCVRLSICCAVLAVAVIALAVLLWQDLHSRRVHNGNSTDHKFSDFNEYSFQDLSIAPVSQPYFPKSSQCAYQHHGEAEYIDFPSLHNFSLYESMGFLEPVLLTGGIEGTLHVQPSTQLEHGVDIRMGIAYATTSTVSVLKSNYAKHDVGIAFEMPELQNTQQDPTEFSCLSVFIGLEIRQGLELEIMTLATMNLDLVVADGLFDTITGTDEQPHLLITGETNLQTMFDECSISYWASGRTNVEAEGSIRGHFALNDLLSLKTSTGDIYASVDPKPAKEPIAVPAEFSAVSESGAVVVRFPMAGESLPLRDYRTRIETISSPILGRYIVGTSFSASTTSGDIHAQLLPYYHPDNETNTIHTESGSGETKLKLLPPYPEDSWPSKSLEHKSKSTNGSIEIVYPEQWEGDIEAQTLRGSFSIKGTDVEIIDDSPGPGLKHVTARKGSGSGHLEVRTTSGDISVCVGED